MAEKFEQWAIIELFGHQRIAGLVTEQAIGGETFIRVDVPASRGVQPMTKCYGKGAVYCMSFVDEETARAAAGQLSAKPMVAWSARRLLELDEGGEGHVYGFNGDTEELF